MDIVKTLTERGLRATPHRVRIAEKVLPRHCHFTAEEISRWAAGLKSRLSRATVYNILNELVAVGLLRSMYLPSVGKTIYDSNPEPHHHLYDLETGAIHDVETEAVKMCVEGAWSADYRIEDVTLVFSGRRK